MKIFFFDEPARRNYRKAFPNDPIDGFKVYRDGIIATPFAETNEIQDLYLQPIITQYFIDNKSEIWLLFLIAHSKRWRFNAFIDY